MPRNDQIERQWRVWMHLAASSTPLSAAGLARQLGLERGTTSRTIRRDLEVLRSIGVPVHEERRGRDQLYSILDDGPPLRLDPATVFALRLAVGLLRPFQGTLVAPALEQLRKELEKRVPPRLAQHFAAMADVLTVKQPGQPRYGPGQAPVLTAINDALAAGKTLVLAYTDLDGRASRREVDPQGLVYGPRGLYLLAHDRGKKGALRTFRVERVRSAQQGKANARRTGQAERLLDGSLGVYAAEHAPRLVRLRVFDARTARLLEENPWHTSQRVRRRGEQWEVTLRLTSFRELASRILALGPAAEVVAPSDLVDLISSQALLTCARYSMTPPRSRLDRLPSTISAATHRAASREPT